jgi:hypothetical protein
MEIKLNVVHSIDHETLAALGSILSGAAVKPAPVVAEAPAAESQEEAPVKAKRGPKAKAAESEAEAPVKKAVTKVADDEDEAEEETPARAKKPKAKYTLESLREMAAEDYYPVAGNKNKIRAHIKEEYEVEAFTDLTDKQIQDLAAWIKENLKAAE